MSSEWPFVALEQLTINHDPKRKPVKEADRKSGPYPYYGASGIVDYVDDYIFDGEYLLIAEDGENLKTRQTPIAFRATDKFWVNNHAHIVEGNGRTSTRYLEYAVLNSDVTAYLTGAVMPKLTKANLNRMEVPCPPVEIQNAIVSVLGTLDDRITLLRETNATLEAIAQALFKSWFVDFDPVHANAHARAQHQNSHSQAAQPNPAPHTAEAIAQNLGLDAATAALFPDHFQDSDLGPIPAGWRVGKVEDVMEFLYGKALKATDRKDGSVPVYGSGGITGYHNQYLVKGPSIIVGRKGTVGSLYWEDQPFFPIDTVFYVKTDHPLTYCYYLLQTLGLEDMNTDGAVPGLNRGNAYRLPVVIPDTSVLNAFDKIISSLRTKVFSNFQQAQTLTQLRDTLLPRLISGQLRLPGAEALVEALDQ